MNTLLDPKELRLLDGLRLSPRKSFTGRVRGERMTVRKGISIEFADYRDYVEGDDLRHLDWNVLARLDAPVMKTYRDEEDLAVHLLVDVSPSMEFGEPTKLSTARRIACAIGYIALNGGDAAYVHLVGARAPVPTGLRSRSSYPRLSAALQRELDSANVGLSRSLREFAKSSARTGLVVLLTDGLDPEVANAIRVLGGRGHELMLLQILSEIELDPDLEGDLRLLDAETGAPVEITANSYALKEYRRRLDEHNAALAEAVRRIGGRYALIRPDQPLQDIVRDVLRKEKWAT